ncbi:MAG: hypothetical protein J1E34_06845 [Oscillospiraceae bacterium]|nr:hypothetical protein [Oscillospiraceae bacterium]
MTNYTIKTKASSQIFTEKFLSNALGSAKAVNSAVFDKNGRLYIGTDKGIMYSDGGRFTKLPGIYASVPAVCALPDCGVIFSSGNDIFKASGDKIIPVQTLEASVTEIKSNGSDIFAISAKTLFKYNGEIFENVQDIDYEAARALSVTPDGEAYISTDEVIMRLFGKRPRFGNMVTSITNNPKTTFRALAADSLGSIWCGADEGLYIFDGKSEWVAPNDLPAFPKCRIDLIEFGKDNIYVGTPYGLYIVNGENTRFYGSGRYLTGNQVTCVAVSADESVIWVGTDNGLSRIEMKKMTLAEKAQHFENMMPIFHREGYYTQRVETSNGDIFNTGHPQITDNDGLYTADYVAFMSLKYAVTGDEQCKNSAKESMKALLKLQNMTGVKGFPARAYRRPGEDRFGDGDIEWHLTSDEIGDVEWKGETSSDELVGHYFGSCWYYDLCADEDEKAEIAQSVKNITDHILTHGYTLCDADGLPTTWAHFGPEELNHDNCWCWEKGVNSLELISFLLITHHMTGEKKYLDLKNELASKNHYAMNVLTYKRDDAHSNNIDDRLTLYIATHLLRLETDSTILKYVKLGIRRHYEYIIDEYHPYFTFIFAFANGGSHAPLNEAVRVLEEYPIDRRFYKIDNSIRPDVVLDERVKLFGERDHAKYPFPASERITGELHSTGRELKRFDETSVSVPTPWLLSYWMGVYLGYIE